MSRPRCSNPRDQVKPVRFTQSNWQQILQAAELFGMAPGVFVRSCAVSQAQAIIDRHAPKRSAKGSP